MTYDNAKKQRVTMLDRMLARNSNNTDESDTNMEHELCNPWKSMMNKLVYDQQSTAKTINRLY